MSSNTSPQCSAAGAASGPSPFDVPFWLHWLGGFVDRHPRLFQRLANLESTAVAESLKRVDVTMPIFVCGLARSGTTLLHEVISSHPAVATHRIKDYPLVLLPYWWRRATAKTRAGAPRERAHRDRIMITAESPDALEEMLWMTFFPHCHDPAASNVLGAAARDAAFEAFYRNHLRKLLLAEHATRYAAKANYHVARLAYLARLFPDARFVLAVRSPVGHVASLARQHERFCQGHRHHPRSLAYMQRSGHFEFGLDRRPMNLGDSVEVERIVADWEAGGEVRGLARYWTMVYSYLDQLLAADADVRRATLVVRFETLCDSPAETLSAVLRHCDLTDSAKLVESYAPTIRRPAYYTTDFSPDELRVIDELTTAAARRWGF
ncbi:MAG TPA: sulfotransferase [Pirellulales bacterium]|nr:sulfotransferase [Pirellulales bacterium]